MHEPTRLVERIRLVYRPRSALLIFGACGIAGVAIDIDHIVCAIMGLGTLDIQEGLYGCRLWHSYILPLGGIGLWMAFALWIGLYLGAIFSAVKSTVRTNFT